MEILKQLRISIVATLVLLVITCGFYPALIWGVGKTLFRFQAEGSLVKNTSGQIVGSALLAQGFTKAQYFQPRPSAAGAGYDPTASGGTNLGPTSDKLIHGIHLPNQANGQPNSGDFDGVKDLAVEYRTENGLPATALVPVDAVTRSASGLDPDISPENAALQEQRVATARGVSLGQVRDLVAQYTKGPDLGFIGSPRVNVLNLNLALDAKYPAKG